MLLVNFPYREAPPTTPAFDIGTAAASSLPPLIQLPASEKDWLEVLTTTDRFFKVRLAVEASGCCFTACKAHYLCGL